MAEIMTFHYLEAEQMGKHQKTMTILEAAHSILAAHNPMTVRQVYYQLFPDKSKIWEAPLFMFGTIWMMFGWMITREVKN